MQRQTPSCVDIHETMPVDNSTTGLFFRGFGVAFSNAKNKPLHVLTFLKPCQWIVRPPAFFRGGLELHVPVQRRTPSCVDIHETRPVDSSTTTGLFLGGFGVACSNAKTNPIMC